MGLEVSPMCDRDTISLCNMQMGFIEFVVAPLIIGKLGAAACDCGCVCGRCCTAPPGWRCWYCLAAALVCSPLHDANDKRSARKMIELLMACY
jgi:hypothetical protein